MAISADELVGYLRAEFDKASRWRIRLLIVQFAGTIPAALSVVIKDETYTYFLALAAPVVILAWWLVRMFYLRARGAAHAARRASLVHGGLGADFSPQEHQRLRQVFTVDEETARARANTSYYASNSAPGLARLAELLEESAFYSKDVHKYSAVAMGTVFGLFVIIAIAAAFVSVPFAARPAVITWVRIGLAVFVFLLSSDVLGAMAEHREACRQAASVQSRMAAAAARGYPQGDIMLAMVDYNNAMEGAPEAFPGVFRSIEGTLNRRWAEYKADREETRSVG